MGLYCNVDNINKLVVILFRLFVVGFRVIFIEEYYENVTVALATVSA